jgi:uncharacterized membrane protein
MAPAGRRLQEAKTTQTNYGEQHPHRVHPFAWAVLGVVVISVVVFFALIAIRGYPTMPMSASGYPGYGWWFFFPFGIFFFLIFLFFVGRLIFWPWGGGWRRRYYYGYGYGDAREIIRQRYARGEITKDQFDQMMRDLEQR